MAVMLAQMLELYIFTEKKKLYDTLLSFPPFFTSIDSYLGFKSILNLELNKSVIGLKSFIITAESCFIFYI